MQGVAVGPVSVVWSATSPGTGTSGPDPTGVRLSDDDRVRAASFVPDRRRAFLVGRSLIAGLVGSLFPAASGWSVGTGPCRRCGARHGAVEITGVPVVASLSYAPGLVVAAGASSHRVSRLGIDVELDAANAVRSRDLQRLLGPSSGPPLMRWTRVEAVLKADGRGLGVDPGDVRVRAGRGRIAGDPARYRVADVVGPTGYVVSLAWCGAGSSGAGSDQATG